MMQTPMFYIQKSELTLRIYLHDFRRKIYKKFFRVNMEGFSF